MKLLIILSLAMGGVPPDASTCSSPLDRASVARCARRNSPTLAADLERVASTRGEELEARTLLPSNPRVDLSLARRADTMGGRALNLYGTLSQAIELGGQRRKRVAVVQSQREVYQHRAALTEREAVAAALLAYYDALAAERELALIERATQTADRLHALAVERVGAGVGTGLDQELAAAVHARHEEERAMANGKLEGARARLSSLVGLDPTVESVVATGELEPVPLAAEALASLGDNAVQQRPEIAQARAVREVQSRRLDLLRRDRIPDPSLSVFVQRDGFDERVVGGGLSIPIPLPSPLGRLGRGRIEAARGRVREAEARISAEERWARLETATAYHEYQARRDAAAAYSEEAGEGRSRALTQIAAEIEAGRLPVREALVTQEALLDALLRQVEVRHQLCRASVGLALAAGLPLEGGAR